MPVGRDREIASFEAWRSARQSVTVESRVFGVEVNGTPVRVEQILGTQRDCIALVPWPQPSVFSGLDSQHTISDVRIENLVVAGRPVRKPADLPLEMNEHVESVVIE